MMTIKTLSIITVTKNCSNTIERTLKSVQQAKSEDVEYIIVDGVSNDGTLEVIYQYLGIIDQLICEQDAGIYQAMNKGITKANGKYILFINGDDELIPSGVKEVLSRLRTAPEPIICATTLVASASTKPLFPYIPNPKRLVYGDSLPHPSTFVSRELLSQFPFREDLKIASDFDFFLKNYTTGTTIKIMPYETAIHYLGGVSSNSLKRKKEVNLILRSHLGRWHTYFYRFINIFIWGFKKFSSWRTAKGSQ